jgi:hypothetical protein
LCVSSSIVVRVRHRASLQIMTGLLAGPQSGSRQSISLHGVFTEASARIGAVSRSLMMDEHVSADHALDDSEERFERSPIPRHRDRYDVRAEHDEDETSDAISRTRNSAMPRRLARPLRSSFRRVSLIVFVAVTSRERPWLLRA